MNLRTFTRGMVSVSALALAATAVPAFAQDAANDEGAEEPEVGFSQIIVTANRRAEAIQDVPIAVTALNEELIEQKFSRDLLDLGSIAPNLVVDPILGNGTAAISIRGIQLNDVEKSFDPPVGVFLDGVYLASTTGALLNVFDAETIEVLRGPQGTLFGRNTIGGLMHVRRNKPTGELGGKMSVTYGRFDQFDIKGVLNLPEVAGGAIKAKVAVVRLDGGGYFYNATRKTREGNNNFFMISPMVQFELGNRGELTVVYDYIRDRTPNRPVTSLTEANQLFGLFGGVGAPASDADYHRTTLTPLPQPAKVDTHAITANGVYELADGHELHAVVSYRENDERSVNDFDGVAGDLFNAIRPQNIDQFYAELRYQADLGAAKLVSGLYFFDSSYNVSQQAFIFGNQIPGTDYQQNAKSYAAFAQLDWEVIDNPTLTLGGRYLKDKKTACGGTAFGPPEARDYDSLGLISFGNCSADRTSSPQYIQSIDGSATWSKFTPKVGLSYQFANGLVYASYSEGFRSGGFNGRGDSIDAFGPYDPEKVENMEVGFKTDWLNNRLIVNLTAFHTKYKNKQEDVVFPILDENGAPVGTTTVVQNAASATIKGFELETRLMPTPGLTFGLSVGHLNASYDEWFDVAPLLSGPDAGDLATIDKSNFKLRRAPDWTVQADVNYEYLLGNGDALIFAADYSLKDDYYIVANTVNIHTVLPGGRNPGLVDSYGLLNASISYKAENFKLSFFGRNLTGTDYFQHVLDVGTTFGVQPGSTDPVPTFGLWSFGTINPPTTYGAELTFEF